MAYTGGTTINAGTLLVKNTTNSTGSGPVTINSAATLGGSGKITGPVTLNTGGFIAPGAGSTMGKTTLDAASLTWNPGGTLSLQLGATTGDELVLTGSLTKGSTGSGACSLDLMNVSTTTLKSSYTLATSVSTTFSLSDFTVVQPADYTGMLVDTGTSLIFESVAHVQGVPDVSTSAPSSNSGAVPGEQDGVRLAGTPEPGSAALLTLGVGIVARLARPATPTHVSDTFVFAHIDRVEECVWANRTGAASMCG